MKLRASPYLLLMLANLFRAGNWIVGRDMRAGLFIHLMPAFGILLAAVFLGERLMSFHLIGIALIFGGIYLTTRQ